MSTTRATQPAYTPPAATGPFAALTNREFRWFLSSTLGQMAALNMQALVRGFLTFEMTESFAALGTLFLVNSLPGMALALFGGVLADRVRRRKRIVQAGQLINAANATVVGLMLAAGVLRFEHLLIAALLQGSVNSIMMPARQAMLPGVVGMPLLTSAVAVNAAGRDSIRLLAPAAGGWLIAAIGAYWVYFLMAGMYLFATASLTRVSTGDTAGRRRASGGLGDLVEGVRYVVRDPTLRPLLLFNILFAMLAMPYVFLLPGFVAAVIEGGAERLGLLLSLIGVGSLGGALVVGALGPRRRGLIYLLSVILQGTGLIVFASSSAFAVSASIVVVIGLAEAVRLSLSNVLVQTYVEDEFRGRVMSVYMMQRSLAQFGAFFAGLLAAVLGVQLVLGAMALALVLLATAVVALHERLRTLP
jgi:MFS family permease